MVTKGYQAFRVRQPPNLRETNVIISFDIDGCVTKYPEQFLFMGNSIRAAGGELHFITGRPECDRQLTVALLAAVGFTFVLGYHARYLHMFPEPYEYPWRSEDIANDYRNKHAHWKAHKCLVLGVQLHYDDCPVNIDKLYRAGVPVFQVH